jgi:general secretion pathway protein H
VPCQAHRATSATSRGFTLLEVITVVFIIGVIVSFAGLSVSQNQDHRVRDEAERIVHLLRLGSEEAVLQGRELAMQISKEGYLFVTLEGEKWVPLEGDNLFRKREFPDLFTIELEMWRKKMNLDDDKFQRIKMLSSGEMDPFVLLLKLEEGGFYTLTGDLTGQLEMYPPGQGPQADG